MKEKTKKNQLRIEERWKEGDSKIRKKGILEGREVGYRESLRRQ